MESQHADLLNSLDEMQHSIAYAIRRHVLAEAERVIAEQEKRNNELAEALEESVKLQSFYAMILNGWDSGERMQFANAQAWIDRLKECKAKR